MSKRTDTLKDAILAVEGDLDRAREAESYTAVANLHRIAIKLRSELAALEEAEDEGEEDDEAIVSAICDGILALPDEGVERVSAALEERRRRGRV